MSIQMPSTVSGALPLIGHALEMLKDRETLFKRGYAEHGNAFTMNIGPMKAIVLSGEEYNRFVFNETDKAFNVQDGYQFLRPSFGENFFIVSHESYLNMRPVIQELFRRQPMVAYVEAMNKEVQLWLDSLGEEGETDLTTDMLNLTQYVVGRAFIGDNFREEVGDEFWGLYESISISLDFVLPPKLPIPKFVKRDRARIKMIEILNRIIDDRRANPGAYDDMFAFVLDQPQKDGHIMSNQEIIDFFSGLLFAGHETTAGQAAWTVAEILRDPDYLSVIQQEIEEHFTYGESITGAQLRHTPHIYYAIDEVTRMHPSGELILRTAEDDIELDEYVIPKGTRVFLSAVNTHNQPTTWTNPEKFDPYRWSPERNEGKNIYSIIGFGGGMHKCTGMNFAKNEMAIIVGLLFQQFDVELLSTNIEKVSNGGASRPSEVRIRYRRKSLESSHPQTKVATTTQIRAQNAPLLECVYGFT